MIVFWKETTGRAKHQTVRPPGREPTVKNTPSDKPGPPPPSPDLVFSDPDIPIRCETTSPGEPQNAEMDQMMREQEETYHEDEALEPQEHIEYEEMTNPTNGKRQRIESHERPNESDTPENRANKKQRPDSCERTELQPESESPHRHTNNRQCP